MVSRSNTHIKKFNQLVDVHEPEGVDRLETVTSRETEQLQQRLDEILALQSSVERLTSEELFDERERDQIAAAESMPDPEEAAASTREEMLGRLHSIEDALEDTLAQGETLDASDDLNL